MNIRSLTAWIAVVSIAGNLPGAASADQSGPTVRVAAVQFISLWAKPVENRKAID